MSGSVNHFLISLVPFRNPTRKGVTPVRDPFDSPTFNDRSFLDLCFSRIIHMLKKMRMLNDSLLTRS